MRVIRCVQLIAVVLAAPWAFASPAAGAPLAPQIHTFAGGGSCGGSSPWSGEVSGGSCDNVSATSVQIGSASSVAELPGGGFLYVDSAYDFVRQVSRSGKVTTVAGDLNSVGQPNTQDAPDGTPAVNSGLNDPVSVATLPNGGFLITEYAGSVVRMVAPDGTISTVVGSGLNAPSQAVPTANGGIVIADTGNGDVRLLDPNGNLSTIAGGGSCDDRTTSCDGMPATGVHLHDPVSVSPIQGGSGGYLIAEADNADNVSAIREISPSGTFTTVAGIPGQPRGYSGDGGPATSALLSLPQQVLSTPDGGFMIADSDNERIRDVSPSGTITTVAGNGIGTFGGDGGDATAASFQGPAGVSPTPDGGFLVADSHDGAIRAVTIPPTTTIVLSPAAPNGNNGWYNTTVHATMSVVNGAGTNCELDPAAAPPVFDAISAGCAFSGKGADISGDGSHTLYAASIDKAGDKEFPVSVSLKMDTTPPTLQCINTPSFPFGTRNALVSATVADSLSGPASPVATAVADTSTALGSYGVTVFGRDLAGNTGSVGCSYNVVPLTLKPRPAITWKFSTARSGTMVQRLLVKRIPPQASVNLTCAGTGCPFSAARNVTGKECKGRPCTASKSKRHRSPYTVNLSALFARVALPAGVRLTVSITASNTIGRAWHFTTRSGKPPSHMSSCLQPGSLVSSTACSAPKASA